MLNLRNRHAVAVCTALSHLSRILQCLHSLVMRGRADIRAINLHNLIAHAQDLIPTSGPLLRDLGNEYPFVILLIRRGASASGDVYPQAFCVSMDRVLDLKER